MPINAFALLKNWKKKNNYLGKKIYHILIVENAEISKLQTMGLTLLDLNQKKQGLLF